MEEEIVSFWIQQVHELRQNMAGALDQAVMIARIAGVAHGFADSCCMLAEPIVQGAGTFQCYGSSYGESCDLSDLFVVFL